MSEEEQKDEDKSSPLGFNGVSKIDENFFLDFSNALKTNELSDVTVQVGTSGIQTFHLHRTILSLRSPVFLAMLNGPMLESKTSEITLTDIEPVTFGKLVEYIYLGHTEISQETGFDLLMAADKYSIHGLSSECQTFLSDTLSVTNVISVANHSEGRFNLIHEASLKFILSHMGQIISGDDFLKLNKETFLAVLKAKEIQMDLSVSETDLFHSIIAWSRANSLDEPSYQAFVEELALEIRYTDITRSDLVSVIGPAKVLPLSEYVKLLECFMKGDKFSLEVKKFFPRKGRAARLNLRFQGNKGSYSSKFPDVFGGPEGIAKASWLLKIQWLNPDEDYNRHGDQEPRYFGLGVKQVLDGRETAQFSMTSSKQMRVMRKREGSVSGEAAYLPLRINETMKLSLDSEKGELSLQCASLNSGRESVIKEPWLKHCLGDARPYNERVVPVWTGPSYEWAVESVVWEE